MMTAFRPFSRGLLMITGHDSTTFGQQLDRFLTDVETAAGVSICLHDRAYLTRLTLPNRRYSHNSRFCGFVKGTPQGDQRCRQCDIDQAVELMRDRDEPVLRHCHAGVAEVLVPVRGRDRLLGIVFCGQVFLNEGGPAPSPVPSAVLASVPRVERERLLAAGRIVHCYLRDHADVIATLGDMGRPSQHAHAKVVAAMQMLERRFTGPVTLDEAARHVGLSTSHFAHLFKKYVTVSFTDWLRRRRMREAMRLLRETDINAREIAQRVGFDNPSYFHRQFKREVGVSPLRFRRDARAEPRA